MYSRKLLISFLLTLTLGIITCWIIFYTLGDKLLGANINTKVHEVDGEFRKAFSDQETLLTALVETIENNNNPEIVKALQKEDKAFLFHKYRNLYIQLRKSHGVTHFSFHLPDRKNLTRVHLPKLSGDLISRPSLIKAATTGLVTSGLEQGSTGSITLRVVKPITLNKKTIGYIELGTDISYILKNVRQHLSVDYTVLISKDFLESDKWNGQIEKSPDQSDWDTLENYVVVGSSDRTDPQKMLSQIQASLQSESSNYLDVSGGHFWKNYPLLDFDNQKMGLVLIHGSIAELLSPLFRDLAYAGLLFVLMTALWLYSSWKICKAFIRSNEVAKHSAQLSSLGEMTSGITHEIANPVTIISLCAVRLKALIEVDPLNKNRALEKLDRIDRMASRIAKISSSMKLASRHADNDPLNPTSIENLISDTIEICTDKFQTDKVELHIGQIPNCTIHCRSSQISQVLINLLNNARDAVSKIDEKWVKIEVETTNTDIKIYVTDSGKGIPKKIVARMMSPFFTTKDVNKGTGLGLSISQDIIHQHHGKLYYDSNYANTRFVIELPIRNSFAAHI